MEYQPLAFATLALSLLGCDSSDSEESAAAAALVETSAEPAGDNCAESGVRVDSGVDEDGDGALSDSEIDSTQFVCNGPSGEAGPAGSQGEQGARGPEGSSMGAGGEPGDGSDLGALIRISHNRAECMNDASLVEVGIDQNGDGTLSAREVTDQDYTPQCFSFDDIEAQVNTWAGTSASFSPLYDSDEDGWSGSTFDTLVGDVGPAYWIVKLVTGEIIGGYISSPFADAELHWHTATDAFIFSITKNAKFERVSTSGDLYYEPGVEFTFGFGYDVKVTFASRLVSAPMAGSTFACPLGLPGSDCAQKFLETVPASDSTYATRLVVFGAD